jgi:hypothetical protein
MVHFFTLAIINDPYMLDANIEDPYPYAFDVKVDYLCAFITIFEDFDMPEVNFDDFY